MDIDYLLREAGFEDISKSKYLEALVEKTDETQKQALRAVVTKYSSEKGIVTPEQTLYQIVVFDKSKALENYFQFYEISEKEVVSLLKQRKTIQQAGIEPKYTDVSAIDELLKIKKQRQRIEEFLKNPANIF